MAMLPQSPSQTVGPFFHDGLIFEDDNVLTNKDTQGEHIILIGTVFDGDGVAVPDALIEIWQADAAGIFNHPDDPNHSKADPNFKGFGRSDTAKNDSYRFETIKPSKSSLDDENQAPYIRLRVFSRGMLMHATTRIYFSEVSDDPILNVVPVERRGTLMAKLEPPNTYRFDIHLQGEKETVFFDI